MNPLITKPSVKQFFHHFHCSAVGLTGKAGGEYFDMRKYPNKLL